MINSQPAASIKVLYKDKTLWFDIPDQSGSLSNAVFVFPTFEYNSSGLNKISWEYYSGTSGAPVDAEKIILTVGTGVAGGANFNISLYESPNYDPKTKQVILPTPIAPSFISVINMGYNDIFGNSFAIGYKHP